MKYIETLTDGMRVSGVYLCRQKTLALTRNGKEYLNVLLQDKTGQLEAKVWDPQSPGIRDFDAMDYVSVTGNITLFNNANQMNIQRISRAEECEYDPADYFPVSRFKIDDMRAKLEELVKSLKNPWLKKLCSSWFLEDERFMKRFCAHSAAKSIHHGFIGGLLEHTLSVAEICDFAASHYSYVNRDLLLTGALLHDIGKLSELSDFPNNDYTDAGQLLGHIMIGASMAGERMNRIQGFPERLRSEVLHLILSHHGEYEYGSPKKPALIEAMILSFADNMDAKAETMFEAVSSKAPVNADGWLGFNKLIDSNLRKTDGT